MGFLTPSLLFLGAAVAVPLILHLFQRHQGPRVVFPALRYLRRAEREHARRVKLRQWLLMALRMAALVLLALAAARPFVRQGGGSHEPTAVAIVLDNSLSSGLVDGDRRVLDELKRRALEVLAMAGPDDRFWLIRAATPWEAAVPGDAASTAERVRATEPVAAAADLAAALARARTLLAAGAEGRATEIHLLSDLQATSIVGALEAPPDAPPVIVWAPRSTPPPNAGIASVQVGGGLAPRAGERSTVDVALAGSRAADTLTVRLALEGRLSGAATAEGSGVASLPFPARTEGIVTGWVELEPDALRGDDRRYFAVRVQPPPAVALTEPVAFVQEALDVLTEAGRVRRTDPGAAEVLLAPGAAGIGRIRPGQTLVILAPTSSLELAAANNRLAQLGVPWRFGQPRTGGEARFEAVAGDDLSRSLEEVRVREYFPLEPVGAVAAGSASSGAMAAADSVLLRLRDGSPWAVRGDHPAGGRYVILASALTLEATSLPTSAAMLPLLDRMIGPWASTESGMTEAEPGTVLALHPRARRIERPDGNTDAVEGGARYRVPALPGIYRVMGDAGLIEAFAVNPPVSESDLTRLEPRRLAAALPGWTLRLADDADSWARHVFQRRLGREIWRPLLILALALLLVEALVASAGRLGERRAPVGQPGDGRPIPGNDPVIRGAAGAPAAAREPVPSSARSAAS